MSSHGHFLWNELNTHHVDRAKAFYEATIGWTFVPMPMGEGMTYWLAKVGETSVAGFFEMSGPYFEGVPDHWLPYLGVDDVDARIAKLPEAGGTVLRAPWDIPGVGRIAIVKDATGAVAGWMTPPPGMQRT